VLTIYIHGEPYRVKEGSNLLEACLSHGFNVPYFCWHPAIGSIGACRQCAVKVFRNPEDTKGTVVMSCMAQVADGMHVSIDDPEVVNFRARVIEWLMLNHPHDCPVCDEGGECHLQDMTVMTGHTCRRTRFPKRTHVNQDLGPFVAHEMNRCIQCYRCQRFYCDYAGGRDFDVFGWHDHVFFGRSQSGTLESEFAGNLVEICPTGVFTDKTFARHYTRKWDLTTAPSICVHCGAGCNTIPGGRYGQLRRIRNRFNSQVNGYFLCDRGRYGYDFVNSPRRMLQPMLRDDAGKLVPATKEQALAFAATELRRGKVIGIGSPRASLEANFALRKLVGQERFFQGQSARAAALDRAILACLRDGPTPTASLKEVQTCDAVVILGEDVFNTAPMLGLALRQASRQQPLEEVKKLNVPVWLDYVAREITQTNIGPVFIGACSATRLDGLARQSCRAAPDELARAGLAIAHLLDSACPDPGPLPESAAAFARAAAEALKSARRPLVVAGPSLGSLELVQAAATIAWALTRGGKDARLCFAASACNSMGAAMLGGGDLEEALEHLRSGQADTVIVLENDLRHRLEEKRFGEMMSLARCVIVMDHLDHATARAAHCVLPAATFDQNEGTLVNNEGRAQRFFKVLPPTDPVQESWRWVGDLARVWGQGESAAWANLDALTAALAGEVAVFKEVPTLAPPADFRQVGQKIGRQPHRYSGRTAEKADQDVREEALPQDADSALAFSMEGSSAQPPPALIPRFWSPGWNSPAALNKFQVEVGGPLRGGDPGERLIEPGAGDPHACFNPMVEAFVPRPGEFLVISRHHIFGSEPLSAASEPVASLSARPYLALNSNDAAAAGLSEGQEVMLSVGASEFRLPLTLDPSLAAGLAAVPAGVGSLEGLDLPAWGRVGTAARVDQESEARP
jgi:NADH-quinone oxidoreductase subunit G